MGPRRWWPFVALFIAIIAANMDTDFLERCTGKLLEGGGRGGAIVRFILAYPCSPFLLQGTRSEMVLFAAMFVPIPFLLLSLRWMKRHDAYWDRIREREKVLRAKRRASRKRH